jgi:hypothetical protein
MYIMYMIRCDKLLDWLTLNCCLGMSSFSLSHTFFPMSCALSLCTMVARGGASSPLMRMSNFTRLSVLKPISVKDMEE